MVLPDMASLSSWSLHGNFGFTLMAPYCGLSGAAYRDSSFVTDWSPSETSEEALAYPLCACNVSLTQRAQISATDLSSIQAVQTVALAACR